MAVIPARHRPEETPAGGRKTAIPTEITVSGGRKTAIPTEKMVSGDRKTAIPTEKMVSRGRKTTNPAQFLTFPFKKRLKPPPRGALAYNMPRWKDAGLSTPDAGYPGRHAQRHNSGVRCPESGVLNTRFTSHGTRRARAFSSYPAARSRQRRAARLLVSRGLWARAPAR